MNEFRGSEPWHNSVVAPLTNEKTSRRLNGSLLSEKGRGPEISKVNNVLKYFEDDGACLINKPTIIGQVSRTDRFLTPLSDEPRWSRMHFRLVVDRPQSFMDLAAARL